MKLFVSAALATAALTTGRASAAFPSNVAALLDTTVDPCEDFFQYTCGTWVKNSVIPGDKQKLDFSFGSIGDRNEIVIQEILKEDWPLVGEFWDSCMNTDRIEELGAQLLQRVHNKIRVAATKEELFQLAGDLARTGPNFFTSVGVDADSKDASRNVLWVASADLSLPDSDYYLDDSLFKQVETEYRQYITKILNLSGYTPSSNQQQQKQQQGRPSDPKYGEDTVIAIEKKLATLFQNKDDANDPNKSYNPISFGDAVAKFPITFGQFIVGLKVQDNTSVTKDTTIVFQYLEYFEQVERLLASLELKDLKLYLAYLYGNYYSKFLSEPFVKAQFDFFSKTLAGAQTRSPRARVCTSREISFFPDLIGKYYFLKMFDTQREDATKLMVKLVEEAMGEHIQKLTWLDAVTRAEAEKKLAMVSNLIGHSLQKKSYPYALDRRTFFDNIEKIVLERWHASVRNIGQPVDMTEWGMSAATVNAYYSPSKNQMVFPAAILQPPMFNGSSHPAQNFGAIGAIVGHELTHGFDSNGRLYDGYGNQKSWWTPETSAEFDARAQCLKDEYSTFVMLGESGTPLGNVNGNLTITENIADNGGVSLAYDAYQKYIKSPEAVVPAGTQLSEVEANQLFFIAFGQTFCGKARDGYMKNMLATNVHSPGQWRMNGVAMNSEAFTKAFQCKAGAKMNPAKKCVLW